MSTRRISVVLTGAVAGCLAVALGGPATAAPPADTANGPKPVTGPDDLEANAEPVRRGGGSAMVVNPN